MLGRLLLLLAVVSTLATTACVKVAPYERGMLAHPTMTTDDAGPRKARTVGSLSSLPVTWTAPARRTMR